MGRNRSVLMVLILIYPEIPKPVAKIKLDQLKDQSRNSKELDTRILKAKLIPIQTLTLMIKMILMMRMKVKRIRYLQIMMKLTMI